MGVSSLEQDIKLAFSSRVWSGGEVANRASDYADKEDVDRVASYFSEDNFIEGSQGLDTAIIYFQENDILFSLPWLMLFSLRHGFSSGPYIDRTLEILTENRVNPNWMSVRKQLSASEKMAIRAWLDDLKNYSDDNYNYDIELAKRNLDN